MTDEKSANEELSLKTSYFQYPAFNASEADSIVEPIEENGEKVSNRAAALSSHIDAAAQYLKKNKNHFDFSEFLSRCLLHLPSLIEHTGAATVNIFKVIFKTLKPIVIWPFVFIFSFLKRTLISIKNIVFSMPETFMQEVGKMKYEMKLIRKRALKRPDRRKIYFKAMRKYFVISLSRHSIFWKAVLNTVFPLIMIVAVLALFNSTKNKVTALEVLYNGQNIGYVENENVFESGKALAAELVPLETLDKKYSNALNSEPLYKLTRVSLNELSSDKMICENIISTTDASLVHACGIYIDGEFLCAVKNESDAVSVFENMLAPSKKNASPNTIVAFVEQINYEQGIFPEETIWDTLKLRDTLKQPKTKAKYYKIKSGDNAKTIAKKASITISQLKALNPGVDFDNLKKGKKLLVVAESNYVRVKVMKTRSTTTVLKYETERRESSTVLKGTTKTVQKGKNGKKITTELVTYINGKETYSTVVSEKITVAPVKEIIYIGTKTVTIYTPTIPSYSGGYSGSGSSGGYSGSTSGGSYSTGSSTRMIWPTKGAYVLSSRYGYRSASISGWSYHGGVDIIRSGGNSTGIPVVASASGTVVSAVSGYSGYGHTVVIDHGNGIRTRYAHMQPGSITVRPGQRVYQGQQIGRIGSTGNVTGPHLHFEVLINGSKTNPLAYIR